MVLIQIITICITLLLVKQLRFVIICSKFTYFGHQESSCKESSDFRGHSLGM